MNAIDDSLATVATVGNEFEAQLLVNLLKDEGIAARATGFWTSQFRAEAPGSIRVVVDSQSLAAARSVVSHARLEPQPPAEPGVATTDRSRAHQIVIWTIWILWAMVIFAVVLSYS